MMEKPQALWALVLGLMLAVTGCGSDGNNGSAGTGGSGGSAGTGGSAGSGGSSGTGGSGGIAPASSTCEAFCAATCEYGPLNPVADGYAGCLSNCLQFLPSYDDNCGPEAEAYIGCCEDNGCNCANASCFGVGNAWSACNGT
jgi:hypothetical protein